MIPKYHFITLNQLMLEICKMTVSPIFRVTFFACLAVRARNCLKFYIQLHPSSQIDRWETD